MNLRDHIGLFGLPAPPSRLNLLDSMVADTIIADIESFIAGLGVSVNQVTVGISEDPHTRLRDHGVDSRRHNYRVWPCPTEDIARHVERHFVNEVGTRGGVGGGNSPTSVYVFARRRVPQFRFA